MLKNVSDITSEGKNTGLNTQDNILAIDKSQSPDMMNVIVHFDGSLEKRLGSNTQNAVIIANSAAAGFSPTGSITNNIVAYWKLDEASGSRFDSIGGNELTDVNNVPSDGGIRNKAALFVATNTQYLIHENTSTLATGDVDFSMSSWIYLNSTSTTQERAIISKRDNSSDSDAILLLHFESLTDNSLRTKVLTANSGMAIDSSQFKFGTSSGLFTGSSSSFLSVNSGTTSDFFIGSSSMTMDFWVRFRSLPGTGAGSAGFGGVRQDSQNFWGIRADGSTISIEQASNNTTITSVVGSWFPSINTWYHFAWVKSGTDHRLFIDGTEIGYLTPTNDSDDFHNYAGNFVIGKAVTFDNNSFDGWIDEYRIIKGRAAYTGNFPVPTSPYNNPSNASQYEYYLYVNTDQLVTFRVSSSGTTHNGSVSASSFGALGTSTWYNIVAYHDTGNFIAVSVNLHLNSAAYASGVRSGSSPFVIGSLSNGASNFFDGRIDETGFWKKVLTTSDRVMLYNSGSANSYNSAFDNKPWASFDFGASSIRWLTVAAGTGVYASSNLGVTWVNIATDRTATYQYFDRSKNVLIATSDNYDTPLAWSGSANTFMTVVNSNAPLCKYSINFQGFLILLNSNTRKRGFFYQDENTQLTGTWTSSFDIPSSQDDEITATFVYRKNLYVSTRYFLYRVSYVGGNPDFSFEKVKDWGFIQRTVKQIYVEGVGQVVHGLCWDGKMRLFDGSDDQISSNNVEQDNELCDFSLEKLSYAGSGPLISFAETDYNENVYKLCLAIGGDSTQTTHMINYDGRSKAFYPFDRQNFNTMVMAESANRRFLMAFDRSGYCHMMNSGNLDGNTTPINDHYDSALLFEKSPAQSQKGHQTHLFFTNRTSGTLHYLDKTDFDEDFKLRGKFIISGSDKKFHVHQVIDVTESYNMYQWKLTSSSGTSMPWLLQRYDHFFRGQGIGQQ